MGSEHPLVIAAADEGERAVALAVALAEWQHVFVDLAIHCADGVGAPPECPPVCAGRPSGAACAAACGVS